MEPEKDFSLWMPVKQYIHDNITRPFYSEREIWWCSVGLNVGFEADGKGPSCARPVLIVKDFNHAIFWCLPVTTRIKKGRYYMDIDLADGISRQVMLSQLRMFDAKRLQEKIGTVEEIAFRKIKTAIARFLVQ